MTIVLLPAPLSPIRATTSPECTVKLAPRSACTRPKLLTMPRASSSGSAIHITSCIDHTPAARPAASGRAAGAL